jgi:hypothetical protein
MSWKYSRVDYLHLFWREPCEHRWILGPASLGTCPGSAYNFFLSFKKKEMEKKT